MKDPIQKYFQVGTIQWMSFPPQQYDLLESVKRLASDEFFTAVEVTKVADDDTREKLKRILAQSHMTVSYTHLFTVFRKPILTPTGVL